MDIVSDWVLLFHELFHEGYVRMRMPTQSAKRKTFFYADIVVNL